MSLNLERQRGTRDLYGEELLKLKYLQKIIENISATYGYNLIQTPIFENINVFIRSVGETSDIVKKEFFNFVDKGGREIALRPEGTAGVIRAVVEDKLLHKMVLPLKLSYFGPMFRYERPQSGRLREFNQYGFEIISSNSIYDDVETIQLNVDIFKAIGLKDYKIIINNLGTFETRQKWINELKIYLSQYKDELTELSKERLEKNPTRILDDKIDGEKEFVKKCPKISNFLTDEEKNDFNKIKKTLDLLKIKYTVDENLVRGLDYYTNFIFEFVSTNEILKGQSTLAGGGRYAKLVGEFGDVDTSCVGFAIGMERVIKQIDGEKININFEQNIDIVVACLDEKLINNSIKLVNQLRHAGYSTVCKYNSNKLIKCFSYAESLKARYIIIFGEKEFKTSSIIIKDQINKKEKKIKLAEIIKYLDKLNK